ncbi:MAG: PKD domain-containing protein [Marmoricola sp.]|nr:PKD domain-containing protein [Marmoricola sp.]
MNHYSVLRTIQDAFGLAPLANSAAASPVLDVWTPGDGNTAPSAAFTSSCTDLGCSFDATGSSDGDGQVVSYAWTYGDGTTGTGVSPSHTYAAAGTYSVKLTVADNGGATDAVTHQVTVTAPAPPPNQPFAADTFARTVATGWGSADTGGAWTTTSATAFSVAPATGGAIKHATKGSQVSASLPGASSNDTDLTLGFNVDKANAGYYLTVVGRRASSGNEYQARIALNTNNTVNAWLTKVVGGTQTSMVAERTVPGLTYTAGTTLRLRLQVTGTAPSTIRVKVWPATSTEPTTWFATTTDTTTALQNPGSLALISYLSSASTTAPVTTHLTDLTASHTS